MDAGRFQRLEEARGKAERYAVAIPHLAPLSAREAQTVRVSQLLSVKVREEQLLSGIVVDVLARIDEAIAGAMLESECATATRARARWPSVRNQRIGRAHGTAIARSHGSQWLQSSYPVFNVCSISRPRKPEQSMKKSASIDRPLSSVPRRCRHSRPSVTSTIAPQCA